MKTSIVYLLTLVILISFTISCKKEAVSNNSVQLFLEKTEVRVFEVLLIKTNTNLDTKRKTSIIMKIIQSALCASIFFSISDSDF